MDNSPACLPQHIGVVMDGNGRWAKKHFLPRIFGHKKGVDTVKAMVGWCIKKHIPMLSLFAFSSENWQRPASEVSFLMSLFHSVLRQEAEELHKQNIRVRVLGQRENINAELQRIIEQVEALTANNTGLFLQLAVDYGGRWDISQAVLKIVSTPSSLSSPMTVESISNLLEQHLAFAALPHPDLFIRTSGEQRISNFMLWQLAYTELYFTDVFWPDFSETEFERALDFFASRKRRFGGLDEERVSSLADMDKMTR